MQTKRTITVYGILLSVWLMVAVWQVFAHQSAKKAAQDALRHRSEDISYSLGSSIKPQGPFFPFLNIRELEPALKDLVDNSRGDLLAIALFNSRGETLASAGEPLSIEEVSSSIAPEVELDWSKDSVLFAHPLNIGPGELDGITSRSAPIVLDDETTSAGIPIMIEMPEGPPPEMSRGQGRRGGRRQDFERMNQELQRLRQENENLREERDKYLNPSIRTQMTRYGLQTRFIWDLSGRNVWQRHDEDRDSFTLYIYQPSDRNRRGDSRSSEYQNNNDRGGDRGSYERSGRGGRNYSRGGGRDSSNQENNDRNNPNRFEGRESNSDDQSTNTANIESMTISFGGFSFGGPRRGMRGMRWLNDEERQELREKRGLHSFILLMSTEAYHAENLRDFWLRLVMVALALAAAIGVGLAWRNIERSDRLQLRLVRASEMNATLREMNIAAAGLAHETRNPLNIVRGLAQMISKKENIPSEIRDHSAEITEEVDRVTSRLNEFMDYSKPQEAKPAPTNLYNIIKDVERTLESDQAEKGIQFELHGPELTVEADEALLRQVLFNLLLNSIQAVEQDGRIEIHLDRAGANEAVMEICDNGPGVPAEAHENIFRPYFTTTKGGTGLGLAVVRQIVLAHRWEINYLPGENGGSRFRISGLKTV